MGDPQLQDVLMRAQARCRTEQACEVEGAQVRARGERLQAPLIQGVEFEGLIADKAFDANWIISELNERGAKIVISQRRNRLMPLGIDAEVSKWRHLIENFFCKLKEFKRIAMQIDKTDTSFEAMIYLGSALINSR